MAALDRFGGPEAWDLHVEEREAEYAAMIADATCLDCGNCREMDELVMSRVGCAEPVGFCMELCEWCTEEDRPAELDCEQFAPGPALFGGGAA